MPKVNAYRKYSFTADVYNYNIVTGQPTQYFLLRSTKLDVIQGLFGKITVILPNDSEDIMQNARLLHLKDAQGKEIYPGGIWTLGGIVPVISLYGKREAFRADTTLTFETAAV